MILSQYLVSVIRTGVPALVGIVLSYLGIAALDIEGIPLSGVITAVAIVGFYAGVRKLEEKWPAFGRLLGIPVAPVYVPWLGSRWHEVDTDTTASGGDVE